MAKIILFSEPQQTDLDQIANEIFEADPKTIAYMPSDGSNEKNPKYEVFWKEYVEKNGSTFVSINNSLRGESVESEKSKILNSDVLILSGGNTYIFLNHLKQSGLDQTIKEFANSNKTILGFSAGAIILSPTIEIVELDDMDENIVGLSDLSALEIIDFDIYPHYEAELHSSSANEYESRTGREVKRIANDEFIALGTSRI